MPSQAAPLRTDSLCSLSLALFGAKGVEDYFAAVTRFLPEIVSMNHHNFLVAIPAMQTYYREWSADFPSEIFKGYQRLHVRRDLILKLAMKLQPGAIIHFRAVHDRKNSPAGWKKLVKHVSNTTGFRDSVSIVLYRSPDEGWGAGLTLWRFQPEPAFSEAEVQAIEQLGPILAAAFTNVWEGFLRDSDRRALSAVGSNTGYLTLLVRKDGIPVNLDQRVATDLRTLCGRYRTEGLPRPLAKVLRRLIRKLMGRKSVPIASMEVDVNGKHCEMFVTPVPTGMAGITLYRVFLICTPGLSEMKLLSRDGFTQNEVNTLGCMQRLKNVSEIAEALGMMLPITWNRLNMNMIADGGLRSPGWIV